MAQGRRRRRRWDDDEKRQIVAQTQVPGVSVLRVARRYDVNANLVFKWLCDPRFKPAEDNLPSFLPVEVLPEAAITDCHSGGLNSRIEIMLTNGHRLIVSGGFDPDAVSRLARGLVS
jgi:transposase